MEKNEINSRLKRSFYGRKTKNLIKKWLEFESIGGFGLGIFDIAPVIVKAEGSYLYDADGKQYLDFLSGFSVSAFHNVVTEIPEAFANSFCV